MAKKYSYVRPTKTRMREIVSDYALLFDSWVPGKDGVSFYRTFDGFIIQKVWFEALRSGEYRPVNGVSVMGNTSDLGLNFQDLDIKHRQVSVRWHENHIEKTSAAMLAQFTPSISEPLTLEAAWDAIDYDGIYGHISYLLGVACLAACLDKTDETVKWISRGLDSLNLRQAEGALESWEKEALTSFTALKAAFNDGTAKDWVREQAKQYESWP